jgi:DNA-directed RNA polymerase subunit RPC12/RpoP
MHTRYLCWSCSREWAYRHDGQNDQCPGCGSAQVTTEKVVGLFDIHTPPVLHDETSALADAEAAAKATADAGVTTVVQAPPTALVSA